MKKRVSKLIFLIIGFILLSFVISAIIVSAQESAAETQTDTQKEVQDFFKKPVIKQIIGIVFGLWDVDKVADMYKDYTILLREKKLEIVSTAGAIIIYVAIWFILFVAFIDIIRLFSPFSKWVSSIIGAGLTIATAQLGVIFSLAGAFAKLTGKFGTGAVFIGIILAFATFFIESLLGGFMKKIITKIKLLKEETEAETTAERGAAGIKHAAEFEKDIAHEEDFFG